VRRWTQNWHKVIFSDKSWLCAGAFHLHYIRRFSGEVLFGEVEEKKQFAKTTLLMQISLQIGGE
jgi:hypothetical protein